MTTVNVGINLISRLSEANKIININIYTKKMSNGFNKEDILLKKSTLESRIRELLSQEARHDFLPSPFLTLAEGVLTF